MSDIILKVQNVSKRYAKDSNFVFLNLNLELYCGEILSIVGNNGSGKSTLLEAIAVAHGFNLEGGTKNYAFSTYDSHSELYEAINVAKGYRKEKIGYFLRAESFYNVATQEEE